MAGSVVNTVIEALNRMGFRAAAAFPGQAMPHVTTPTVAVSLFQVNQQEQVTEVLANVLCPASMGGEKSEAEGLKVTEALTGLGASCVQECCEYDSRNDLLMVPVYAAFRGGLWEAAWIPGGDITVSIGNAELASAIRFTTSRETDDPKATALSDCKWHFTIEEFFYPGDPEPNPPTEPCDITVTRTMRTETYKGCRFTSVRRDVGPTGMRQIREGTAESMIYMAIA